MTVRGLLITATIVPSLIATAMLVGFFLKRPVLKTSAKLWLFAALGVFPVAAMAVGNVSGFVSTTKIDFCAGCHVMGPYAKDARNPKSASLAAIHTRNQYFGSSSCYTCHEDYSMFGAVVTKVQGMGHVYRYLKTYRNADALDPQPEIKITEPYPNSNCTHCHTMTTPAWLGRSEHADNVQVLNSGAASCVDTACHGPPHPVKDEAAERRAKRQEASR